MCHLLKISDDIFLVIHWIIRSQFFGFHSSFSHSHFQSYNYNCTIDLLQLQITF